jgi:hypothetical protein
MKGLADMKFLKQVSALVFFCCILTISSSALDVSPSVPEEPQDWGDPIEVIHSIDEYDNNVVEKIYFVPDSSTVSTRSSSGRGWFKNEKSVANTDEGTMYAKGYFVWGNGDVSVSSPSGGNNGKMSTVSNEKVTSGTGKYAGLFNKYAYVTYSFNTTNGFGVVQYNSVTMRLSESGNQI